MVLSTTRSRGHRTIRSSDRGSRGPRKYVRPSILFIAAQIDKICVSCRLQCSSPVGFTGNTRWSAGTAMDHGLYLPERHLGNVDSDVRVRAEQLEGSGHGIQVYSACWCDGYGCGRMARGTGRKVGIPRGGNRYSCSNWVHSVLIVWRHRKRERPSCPSSTGKMLSSRRHRTTCSSHSLWKSRCALLRALCALSHYARCASSAFSTGCEVSI
jgi:hypothetical protein